jgi:hypothetical protein
LRVRGNQQMMKDGCFGTYEGPEIQKGHVVIDDAQ